MYILFALAFEYSYFFYFILFFFLLFNFALVLEWFCYLLQFQSVLIVYFSIGMILLFALVSDSFVIVCFKV